VRVTKKVGGDLNTRLKTTRQQLGLTQEEIAKKADISTRSYQQYESGERIPKITTALLIARVLNSTVEELFAEAPEPHKH
jgi:transcriptional regulator, XRE family